MRHFIVLGFTGTSTKDKGDKLYLGVDRAAALKKVNEGGGKYRRREMYELAVPYIRRFKPSDAEIKAKEEAEAEAKAKTEAEAKAKAEEKTKTGDQ